MYMSSPSDPPSFPLPGNTPAPIVIWPTPSKIFHSSGPHARLVAYPHFLPLQYVLHNGSSSSLNPFFTAFLSHSSAIRTNPDAISRTSTLVGVASSTKKAGLNFGSSWNARWTCPRL
ncbi:hypothetical protein LguiA_005555 [Lonicera macranthoides]